MPTKSLIKTVELLEIIGVAANLLGLNPIEWRSITQLTTMAWRKYSHYQQECLEVMRKIDLLTVSPTRNSMAPVELLKKLKTERCSSDSLVN